MSQLDLLHSLHSVRRRVRWLEVLFGAGILLASVIILLLTAITLDYLLNLPSVPRLVLVLLAVGAVGYILWNWLVHPLLAKLTLHDIAGRVEQTFPQFQDRLRSTVDIINGKVPGSDAMKDRVVTEATALAQTVNLNRVVVAKPVWYSSAAGLGAILLATAILLSVSSTYTRIALARLLDPLSAHPWPKVVKIDLVGTVLTRIPVGQRLDVNIRLTHGDKQSRKATISYQYGDDSVAHLGPIEQEYMTRDDDGIYHASVDSRITTDSISAAGSMKLWITAGDDKLELPPVKVVRRLTIKSVQAVITAPKYANLPPVTVNLSQAPAVMTVGSTIQLRATFNKPLDTSLPKVESLTPNIAMNLDWARPDTSTIAATLTATNSLRFHLHAVDADGFANAAVEEYELIVRPDQNPSVQIENPWRNEDRTPVAVVPLRAVAEDDFGIKSLKLIVDRLGDKKHWEIPLVEDARPTSATTWTRIDAAGDLQRYRAGYAWDLAALQDARLQSGDVLEYFVQVQDNFDLNNQTHAPVASGRLRIQIISQEEFSNKVADELRAISEQVGQVKQNQTRTQRETANLADQSKDKPAFDPADKVAADRLANQQSTAAAQTKQLSAKLTDVRQRMDENKSPNQELKNTASEVGDLLSQTAESPMKEAAAAINNAKQTPSQSDRNQSMQTAQNNQQQAGDQLQKALDRMGSVGNLSRTIDQIKAILAEQQKLSDQTQSVGKNNLGKRPEEMSPEDRAKLDDIAKAQADLSAQTAKALDQMQQTADKLTKSDPSSSQAMKEAAATGQQQNVAPNQQKAAAAAKQNQQSQAQSAQKQAELGLQMVLNSLREAERRKLEELTRKLEELQNQIAALIRRQAGHNLDNLLLQGPDRLDKIETKERQTIFELAQRDPHEVPTLPDPAALNQGQEQTERNTRDISKSAADLPDGTEAADHLTDAADQMERAIVSLRSQKLADAYDPPQLAALAALQKAKQIVDRQKAAADQKKQDQQKEAIRQVYVKLKEDQEKLNDQTVKIDASPRLEDGALHREDAVRLGQLPGEQGQLADRANKIDEDLSALGSIVFIWANKDIIRTMSQVKDDLGKPDTGKPTQIEQKRIVAQLDAIIRDLAVKPIESKFAQHDNGGGGKSGGKSGPRLPSEAELRLLKDLQLAINDATKELDAQPNKDKPKLMDLGNRQGQMRTLLDQLLRKASNGQMKLGPEPDDRDQLPEEANVEQVENQELDKTLLDDKPGEEVVQKDMNLVGDRMSRSRQRLAIRDDPGKVTQTIQERIAANLDDLIEMARQKEAQTQGQPPPSGDQQAMGKPQPKPGAQAQNQGQPGQQKPGAPTPAGDTYHSAPGSAKPDLSDDIHQKMAEWGGITPRQRAAVIEGAGEQVIEKYKTLVDDYYRSLAIKTNGQ